MVRGRELCGDESRRQAGSGAPAVTAGAGATAPRTAAASAEPSAIAAAADVEAPRDHRWDVDFAAAQYKGAERPGSAQGIWCSRVHLHCAWASRPVFRTHGGG